MYLTNFILYLQDDMRLITYTILQFSMTVNHWIEFLQDDSADLSMNQLILVHAFHSFLLQAPNL